MARSTTVIIGGGTLADRAIRAVPGGSPIIAADSGLDAALAAGLAPTELVGDLDSITDAGRRWAASRQIPTRVFPDDKDATDTELALDRAVAAGAEELLLIGGLGDRFDHLLGALVALGRPALSGLARVEFVLGDVVGHVLHSGRQIVLDQRPGTTFSLVALHGPCTGVAVDGARWPLLEARIEPGSTLGISNRVAGRTRIAVADGVLTVIVPTPNPSPTPTPSPSPSPIPTPTPTPTPTPQERNR